MVHVSQRWTVLWNFVEYRVSFWTEDPNVNQKRAELLWKPTPFQTLLGSWKEVKNKKHILITAYVHDNV